MRTWLRNQPTQRGKMVFCFIFGLYILQHLIAVEAVCETKQEDFGAQNVPLLFNYSWLGGSKLITCSKNQTTIGQCAGNLVISCSIEQTSVGVYSMSSNNDLTSLNLTVLHVNETTTGTYSCSKPGNTDTQSIILEKKSGTTKTCDSCAAVLGWIIAVGIESVGICVLFAILVYSCCNKPGNVIDVDNTLIVTVTGLSNFYLAKYDVDEVINHVKFRSEIIGNTLNVKIVNATRHYCSTQNDCHHVFTIRFDSQAEKKRELDVCKHKYEFKFGFGSKTHSVDWVYVQDKINIKVDSAMVEITLF